MQEQLFFTGLRALAGTLARVGRVGLSLHQHPCPTTWKKRPTWRWRPSMTAAPCTVTAAQQEALRDVLAKKAWPQAAVLWKRAVGGELAHCLAAMRQLARQL